MAITIIKQIGSNKLIPAYNHQNYTLNSTMNGNCNFRYITDIYVNGVFRLRLKTFPDPQTGYGFIQIGRVIEDYVSNALPEDGAAGVSKLPITVPGNLLQVYCRFGEEYDPTANCTGVVTTYPNLATSQTHNVFSGVIDYQNYPTFDGADWTIGTQSSTTKKLMTYSPRQIDVYLNDSYNINFYSADKPASARVVLYKENGSSTTTFISGTGSGQGIYTLACGPYDILKTSQVPNLWPNGQYSGTTSNITCATTHYEVTLMNAATQSVSETFTFNMKPLQAFRTRIGWIGDLGSPERYTFYHRNRQAYAITRREFRKNMYSNIGNEWKYNVGARGRTQLATVVQERHSVSSFVSEENSDWLTSLYMSTEVWQEEQARIFEWRVFRQGNKMIFQVPPDTNLKPGDKFWSVVNEIQNPTFGEYNINFEVVNVYGPNDIYVDCDLAWSAGFPPFGGGNLTDKANGVGVVIEPYIKLPIIVTDQQVERMQRMGRPIVYTLQYDMAYNKNTMKS
jgi:hypothetical protein